MFCSNFNLSRQVLYVTMLSFLLVSCTRYYKPVPADTHNPETTGNVIKENSPNKYFILRQGDKSYSLTNITVDNVAMTMNAHLSSVTTPHLNYINAKGRRYSYRKKYYEKDYAVLKEVHIYTTNSSSLDTTKAYVLPLNQIEKIEVIEHDKGRTKTSYILGGLGITLGVAMVTTIIVALTKSSCPFVSVYNGGQYVVQGELFGGAINRNLERSDRVPLQIQPVNGEFQIRISNELKEKQFTNYANLIVIEHAAGMHAGIGVDGKPYLFSHPVSPASAFLNDTHDILKMLSKPDNINCKFDDTVSRSSLDEITLSFPNNDKSKNAHLVLILKNSYWFDYLFGEFTRHFGNRYDAWHKKQNRETSEHQIQWTWDQNIPLTVSVGSIEGWKEILKLNTIGPLTNREVIIPLEFDDNTSDSVRIKLSTGFMFWELDYAGLDFTKEEPVMTTTLLPYSAIDEKGNDVLSQLTGDDEKYLTQSETGEFATLKYKFDKSVTSGRSYSVVLDTKGYYEPIREYSGKPDIAFLKKFKVPGAMAAFSREKYNSILKYQSIMALNSN